MQVFYKINLLFIILVQQTSCQKIENPNLTIIKDLSKLINESSGITTLPNDDNTLYVINDSGNSNKIYALDQKGDIQKVIELKGINNTDWEDLAYDHQNNLYVGDFGNNNNDRKDLAIYKVSDIQSEKISVSKTEFYLQDQKKFPPNKKNRNFDIEAFVYHDGSFYLFTKNRSSKFNGNTKLYKVTADSGKQVAVLIDEYKICDDPKDCFITGAAINTKGTEIALLTSNKIFILSGFKNKGFFDGTIQKIKLDHYSQKEGICFKNDSILLIVDEKSNHKNGYLYEYRITH